MAKFKKGESGNPGGRPKELGELRELARKYTEQAVETIFSVMNSETASPAAKVAAASALLDRGYGRPEQSMKATLDQIDLGAALQELSERMKAKQDNPAS